VVTLNRPQARNALSTTLMAELDERWTGQPSPASEPS
jgi:enoyl-CoA hydratase/carnithine racemase